MSLQHQSAFDFKLEVAKKNVSVTSFGGLPLLRLALRKLGLIDEMKRFFLKEKGYADEVIIEALILLLAAGGRSLSDWEYLSGEIGFQRIYGTCPSVDALERYLKRLEMIVPNRNSSCGQVGYTSCLERLHRILIRKAYQLAGSPQQLTLDLDATLIETHKREALYSYEGTKAYQPMNVYCPELSMVMAHEFRDGNVSPAEGYQRLVERCREILPGVHFTVRGDAAGYQNDFLEWMTRNKIRYYMTARQAGSTDDWLSAEREWKPLIVDGIKTEQEIADLSYPVSFKNRLQLKWRSRTRRYIAIRREKDQPDLFGRYVYQVIVTNALWETMEESIKQHRGRCGSIEYSHDQLKNQLGMGILPSNDFKVNSAWFSLGCLTHNLLRLLQNHTLPPGWKKLEITTLRFRFLRAAALVIKKARQVILRFCENHPIYEIYCKAKRRLELLPV
jgi:hypothetical protein